MYMAQLTGPTKSGMNMTKQITFERMQKNPSKVTIFGASHRGNNSTAAFHYRHLSTNVPYNVKCFRTYVVLKDII